MNRRNILISTAASLAIMTSGSSRAMEKSEPVVIAHRGASGYLPEHTLAAYEMAIRMGADFIEPDVVATKDGVLVVRHDPVLTDSTNILNHPEFADRKRTLDLGTFKITDFFVSDFTLAELRTLRARQVFADRSHAEDDRHDIPTLEEVIDLAQRRSRETGRRIGLAPEIKFPTLHRQMGLPIEEKLVAMLERAGLNTASAPIVIQSFEQANLKALRAMTPVKLAQLVSGSDADPATGEVILRAPDDKPFDWGVSGRTGSYADMLTPQGLKEVASYADIVAPWKRWLVAPANGKLIYRKNLVADAHVAGLQVYTWTLRDDRLDPLYPDAAAEYHGLFAMGVDGVFSDFPDTAVQARASFKASRN